MSDNQVSFNKEQLDEILQESDKIFLADTYQLKFRGKHSRIKDFVNALQRSNVENLVMGYLETTEDWINLPDLVEKLPNCGFIKLANCSVDDNSARYLGKLISILSAKRRRGSITLKTVSFSIEACQTIADLVNPNRVILHLVQCQLPNIGPFIDALSKTTDQNNDIYYENALNHLLRIDRSWTDDERNALIKLANKKKLLILRKQSSGTLIEIAQIISYSDNLEKVNFDLDCNLDIHAASALAEALQVEKNRPLKYLNLSCGNLKYSSLKALCAGIKKRTTDLGLTVSHFNSYLDPIAELLEHNKLSELELYMKEKFPMMRLLNAIEKNTSLKKLDIHLGPIEKNYQERDIQALANALKINQTLRSLTVRLDGEEDLNTLISTIVHQTKLKNAFINGGVPLSYDYGQLCDILKKSRHLASFSIRQALVDNHDPKITEKLVKSMEDAYSLLSFQYLNGYWHPKEIMEKYKDRNLMYKKRWANLRLNMIVVMHNIARNANSNVLPTDVWIEIFKQIRHIVSPMNGLEDDVIKVFKQYNVC